MKRMVNSSLLATVVNDNETESANVDEVNQVRQNVLQTATVLMFLVMLYVNIALIRYEQIVQTKKISTIQNSSPSRVQNSHDHEFNASSEKAFPEDHQHHHHHQRGRPHLRITRLQNIRKTKTRNYGKLMRLSNLIAVTFGSLRFFGEILEIALESLCINHCDVIVKFKILTTVGFVTSIYSVLWFRQRLCYDSQFMKHLTSNVTKSISISVGVLLVAMAVTGSVLFLATRTYKRTEVGCDLSSSTIPPYTGWIVFAGCTILLQVLLLLLFIYPVYKHRQNSKTSLGQTQSGKNLMSIIKRALLISVICVISDIIAAAITIFVNTKYNIVPFLSYDINLILNLFCILLSFTTWRLRLCPFYYYDFRRQNGKVNTSTKSANDRKQSLNVLG